MNGLFLKIGNLWGAIVLITQNFDPAKYWMDKMQLSEISTAERCGSFSQLFHFETYRFLTTAIFIGSASTVHKSFKIMF